MRFTASIILMSIACVSGRFAAAQEITIPGLLTPNSAPNPLIAPPPPSPIRRLPPVGTSIAPRDWVRAPLSNDLLLEPPLEPFGEQPSEQIPTPLSELIPTLPQDNQILRLPKVEPVVEETPPPPKIWSGSVQFGMDGVEGNSESMNLRIGFDARRKTDLHLLYLNADYTRRSVNYDTTSNRSFSQARYERIIPDTDWTIFEGATGEYDQFQPYVFRITNYAGLGYWLFKTNQASLKTRFGGGFSHDFQGIHKDYYSPELIIGFDYERKISERQRLTGMIEYMPNVMDFQDYRLNPQAGWELLLDQETNLSLRFAVRNRYTSNPGTGKPNDLDYAALLMWKF